MHTTVAEPCDEGWLCDVGCGHGFWTLPGGMGAGKQGCRRTVPFADSLAWTASVQLPLLAEPAPSVCHGDRAPVDAESRSCCYAGEQGASQEHVLGVVGVGGPAWSQPTGKGRPGRPRRLGLGVGGDRSMQQTGQWLRWTVAAPRPN